jgi:GNAT superfamily N-acetyltransferase
VSDYTQRVGTAADVPAVVELMKTSLGEGAIPRSPGFWAWKHERNPFGASPFLVAEAAGKLVGVRVFMRWTWDSAGTAVRAVRAVDTATHPDWRGKRIFQKLTLALVDQMKEEGVGFVFNTPNQMSAPGYLKMGWQEVAKVSVWALPVRPLGLIQAKVSPKRVRSGALPPPSGMAEFCAAPGFVDFLRAVNVPDARYHTVKDETYLPWRYRDVPGIDYGARWVGADRVEAAVIYRTRRRTASAELTLCEVLVRPEWSSVRAARGLIHDLAAETASDYAVAMAPMTTAAAGALSYAGVSPGSPRRKPADDPAPGRAGKTLA